MTRTAASHASEIRTLLRASLTLEAAGKPAAAARAMAAARRLQLLSEPAIRIEDDVVS